MRMRFFSIMTLFTCLVLLSGCGKKGVERYAVNGTVKFKGETLKWGNIRFDFADSNENKVSGGSEIDSNGKYAVAAAGGLSAGTYKVFISYPSFINKPDPNQIQLESGPKGFPTELIPAKYNIDSKQTIVVIEGKSNQTFDFDIDPK
jgi:hypothetical protein